MTETFITIQNGRTLQVGQIVSVQREGTYVVWKLATTEHIREPYGTVALAETALAAYLALLEVNATSMQMIYGTADAPTADPPVVTVAACYRGRTNNTVWMWDTEERAWFPVVSAT